MSFLLELFSDYFQRLHGTASADLPEYEEEETPSLQPVLVDLQSYSEVYRPTYEDELYVYETSVLGRSYGEMEAKLDQLEMRFTFPTPYRMEEEVPPSPEAPPPSSASEEEEEAAAFKALYKQIARCDALLMKDILRLEKAAAALRA